MKSKAEWRSWRKAFSLDPSLIFFSPTLGNTVEGDATYFVDGTLSQLPQDTVSLISTDQIDSKGKCLRWLVQFPTET